MPKNSPTLGSGESCSPLRQGMVGRPVLVNKLTTLAKGPVQQAKNRTTLGSLRQAGAPYAAAARRALLCPVAAVSV